ncbi:MAG: hypothetical protein PHR87_11690 [Sulfurospirillaceae bacterium]|nr:hypothetical protein [Sulfurospirillaceae bacterium]
MAKKRIEPFNPWPGFVDLFASVIMVVLMFMLVLIVNITYYAQFKYKISYTGTVAVQELISKPIVIAEKSNQQVKKESLMEKQTQKIVNDDSQKDLEAIAGMDLTIVDSNFTRQENSTFDDKMVIKYSDKEIILDPLTVKDIDSFLVKVKEKYPGYYISIYIKEPQKQTSASIGKQIALSRALNIRNLIRKKGFQDNVITIKLKEKIPKSDEIEHSPGYALIMVSQKK